VHFDPTIQSLEDFEQSPVYVGVRDGRVMVGPEAPPGHDTFMIGSADGRPVVAVAADDTDGLPYVGLRELRAHLDEPWWSIAGRALQIVTWDQTHRYCGRCATPTERRREENARTCPNCGLTVYPRLSPAIIVLVTRGPDDDEALLVWNRAREAPMYSTIAGFVEPGETLEHAVAREIREETAIEVTDIRYFGSQPWPFPHQLMIGFYARYVSGEIAVQASEIRAARWVTPDDLQTLTTSRGPVSISGWLIDGWAQRISRARTAARACSPRSGD
jgi:NAD+ diphosphatase